MRIRHGAFDWDTWEEASGAWYAALRGGRLGFSGADEVASRLCVLGLNLAIVGAMFAAYERGQSYGYAAGRQDACDSRAGC